MAGFDPEDQMRRAGRDATLSVISLQSKNNIWYTVSKSYQKRPVMEFTLCNIGFYPRVK